MNLKNTALNKILLFSIVTLVMRGGALIGTATAMESSQHKPEEQKVSTSQHHLILQTQTDTNKAFDEVLKEKFQVKTSHLRTFREKFDYVQEIVPKKDRDWKRIKKIAPLAEALDYIEQQFPGYRLWVRSTPSLMEDLDPKILKTDDRIEKGTEKLTSWGGKYFCWLCSR